MTATFFHGASNVRIGGNSQFTNIVAGRDAHQTNYLGDVHNNNSNNKTRTVIQDSFNDNSRSYVGPDAHRQAYADRSDREEDIAEDEGSEWTDGTEEEVEGDEEEDEDEEEDDGDRHNSRRRRPAQKRPVNRRPQPKPRTRARARPSATPQQVRSEPDVRTATPPPRTAPPSAASTNTRSPAPAVPVHTTSAPAVPTQGALSLSSTSPYAQSHLGVPQQGPANASSTSFTQNAATSPIIAQAIPPRPQSANHSALAPVAAPASSELTLLTSPSSQAPSPAARHIDLSARYRYLVARDETRDEIRRMLVNVAQSAPKDKFFVLKDQSARASKILQMIEESDEKIQGKKEVVYLSLESHAVTFIAIMAAQTQSPNAQKVYNLLKILDDVEHLLYDIISRQGISKWKPIKRGENMKLIKMNRERLVTWLQDFQNDPSVKIDFALHEASTALARALDAERQYQITVHPPSQGASSASPANSHMQMPTSPTGSMSISNVTRSAVSLGSGSASVINADGDGTKTIYQNSHNNNSRNYYQ